MDKINGRNIVMESYDKIKKTLAIAFMNDLDANRLQGKMCLSNGECADIEKAFNEQDWPKLARYLDKYTESEDEKTRKTIVATIEQCPDDFLNPKNRDKMLAYLEKQKEPKLAPDDLQKSFEAGQKSIVDNPEQYGLCKKAEWSKEDEEMRSLIVAIFEVNHSNGFFKTNELGTTDMRGVHTEEIISWLKSLRPQPQGIYQQVVKGLRDMCNRYEQNGMFTDGRARDFLDNVRVKCKDAIECAPILDESSWKPSEEQMEALRNAFHKLSNTDVADSVRLSIMYDNLKKL